MEKINKKVITIKDVVEFLNLNVISSFPTKLEIQKEFKKLIKIYHPDTSNRIDAHEKTIFLINFYKEILKNYDFYKKEYENFLLQNKSKEENIWNLLIIEYKNTLIGLPSNSLLYFVHKNDIFFFIEKMKIYVQYKNKNYVFLPQNLENPNNHNNIRYFGLFHQPFFFAIPFEDKIKIASTININKDQIQWNLEFGFIKDQEKIIYIWKYFKNQ